LPAQSGRRFILTVSVIFAVYQVLLPVYAFMPNMRERAVHLSLALILIFLGGGAHSVRRRLWDGGLCLMGVGLSLYVFFQYPAIIEQYGTATGPFQVWAGLVLTLVVLEAARRMVRPALPVIALLFLLYAVFGHLIPGRFGHPPYSLATLSSMLYLTTGGLWGQLLGVSANIIAIFVFLGAFIVHTGGGTGFLRISLRLAGRYTGGPAKVATVSSALFGSVSGSASANVASTGAFTICFDVVLVSTITFEVFALVGVIEVRNTTIHLVLGDIVGFNTPRVVDSLRKGTVLGKEKVGA